MKKNQKRNIKYIAIIILFMVFSFGVVDKTFAINKYWIAETTELYNSLNWSRDSGGISNTSAPGIYDTPVFDDGGAGNITIDESVAVENFIVEAEYSGLITINDGVTLTIGSETERDPATITVGKTGTQIATTTMPATNNNLGGAFTITAVDDEVIITSIKLKQVGSLDSTDISAIELHYDTTDGVCPTTKPVGASSLDSNSIFGEDDTVTFNDFTVAVSPDSPACLYITYSLVDYTDSKLGMSIDFEITNPSTDVILIEGSVATIEPTTRVNISGRTVVVDDNADINLDADACTNNEITSLLSLNVKYVPKNPTVFYLKNCAVWKMEGGGTPIRLTNSNLKVHSLSFTNLTGANSAGTIKMTMEISNVDSGSDPNFLSVTRTYTTTATVRAWSGND
jgi:Fe-S cluster assembly iron-binding protein IscA